ncbi:hypothetical protein, partial [Nocardioides stalactiti]|uniref:hypothetical protein n=1 Tax=Nocardioides stalactiti TaxID=2755356 RepID=UPI001C826DA4
MSLTPLVPAFPAPASGDGTAPGTVPALGDGAGFLAALTAALGQPEGEPTGQGRGLAVPAKGTGCIADESESSKDESGADPLAALLQAGPATAPSTAPFPTLASTPLSGGPTGA